MLDTSYETIAQTNITVYFGSLNDFSQLWIHTLQLFKAILWYYLTKDFPV